MIGVLQNFGSTVYYVGVAPGENKIGARDQVKVVEKLRRQLVFRSVKNSKEHLQILIDSRMDSSMVSPLVSAA